MRRVLLRPWANSTAAALRPETEWTISTSPASIGVSARICLPNPGSRSSRLVRVTGRTSVVKPGGRIGLTGTSPRRGKTAPEPGCRRGKPRRHTPGTGLDGLGHDLGCLLHGLRLGIAHFLQQLDHCSR